MPEATPLGLAYEPQATDIDEDALVDELGSSGFLRSYIQWASDQTDAPRLFHLGTALSIISASMGNKVKFQTWGTQVYPNLWICLLAPSGFYRKSTSVRMGAKILGDVEPEALLAKDWTPEKLVSELALRSDRLMVVEEFGELIARLGRDYNAGGREMLTALYDGDDYERKTKGGGTEKVIAPSLSILAASTIDWISDKVRDGDLRGGFLSRFLFLPAKTKTEFRGIGEGINQEMRKQLVNALHGRAKKLQGAVDFRPVKPVLDEWVRRFEKQIDADPDPKLMGFFSRTGATLLKLSLCFQVAESPPVLTIQPEAAEKAIKFWEYLAGQIKNVVGEQITTSQSQRQLKIVLDIIKRHGKVSRQDLLRESRMLAAELDRVLQTLGQAGMIRATSERANQSQRKPTMYYEAVKQTRQRRNGSSPELPPIQLPDWKL